MGVGRVTAPLIHESLMDQWISLPFFAGPLGVTVGDGEIASATGGPKGDLAWVGLGHSHSLS